MMTQLHGFDWEVYAKRVMPAFTSWLIEHNETTVQQFYSQTRCAREEAMMPPPMRHLQTWTRAQMFIKQLPRGPHAYREYRKLCSAEQFTLLSDRYVYHYPPRLYQDNDALRAIWGAIIEEYCLSWLPFSQAQPPDEQPDPAILPPTNVTTIHSSPVVLPHCTDLKELAQEAQQASSSSQRDDLTQNETNPPACSAPPSLTADEAAIDASLEAGAEEDALLQITEASRETGPEGISLGRHPATLHIRGWLATISVRAMALFELLACGRRSMPFGYRVHEPFESIVGYLTPDEVWQLALCLRNAQPPVPDEPEVLQQVFHQHPAGHVYTFSMPDELSPSSASNLLKAVRTAASQGRGLICNTP